MKGSCEVQLLDLETGEDSIWTQEEAEDGFWDLLLSERYVGIVDFDRCVRHDTFGLRGKSII